MELLLDSLLEKVDAGELVRDDELDGYPSDKTGTIFTGTRWSGESEQQSALMCLYRLISIGRVPHKRTVPFPYDKPGVSDILALWQNVGLEHTTSLKSSNILTVSIKV